MPINPMDLLDHQRLTRVLRVNNPEPKINVTPTPVRNAIITPLGWYPKEESYEAQVQALVDELTPIEKEHCAQGHDPLKPNSAEEKMMKRMQKFGTTADGVATETPASPTAHLQSDFLSADKVKAREAKFGTGIEEMSDARVAARMAKFGTS
mmetsp:Transcript_27035/g.42089  ORF Transcript_27035/g.42089 Transcript_27035/m.42089 type:complete len:152 (-) Transcript_27035:8-463(-)